MAKTWKERQADEARTLHLEIDYHLLTLHEAMESENTEEITAQKDILNEKYQGLQRLSVPFRSRKR
jgi:hypothetical protein